MNIVSKIYTVLIWARYPSFSSRARWYLRFYYRQKLIQAKYYFLDFFLKKPYKNLRFTGEFAPELKFVLPHAYWHYKNGTLKRTISVADTSCLYFFSPSHYEISTNREWNDFKFPMHIPNSFDHSLKYDFSKWLPVPLKDFYRNKKICFSKPTLIVSNKYNTEWGDNPINFLSIDVLNEIFNILKVKYQIIYNRPESALIVNDNSTIMELDEKTLLENHPEVFNMKELYQSKKIKSFNEFQIRVYAGCSSFISVQGGNSVLASYFGGTNIIYAVKGLELEMNEYNTIYPRLSGTKIWHSDTYEKLIDYVNHFM